MSDALAENNDSTPASVMAPEERELLAAILGVASALIVVLDREGRIVLFNKACERTTGYRFEEIKNTTVWDRLLVPEETDAVKAVFEELQAGQFPNEYENFWLAKDGTRRLIYWSNTAVTDPGGKVRYVIGTGLDITERRKLDEALYEAVERNHAILNTAADGIITISELGVIESFNAAAEEIFGYAAADVIGRNVSMLMPASYHDKHDDYLRNYRETGIKRIIGTGREVGGRRKDGVEFPLELAVGEVVLPGRRVYTGIIRDITERKRIEQEARRRLAELAHVSRLHSMGELASGIAHEINQPLTAIVSYAEACLNMLQPDTVDRDTLQRPLERISAQAQRAAEIIRRLRQFVTKHDFERDRVDLSRLVREVLELLAHEISAHRISLNLNLDDSLPPVLGDRVQVEQVILNLVRNAVEAMNALEGMPRILTIETRLIPGESPAIEVAVCDNGPGLPDEEIERMFQAFFTTKSDGMGVGLSISRTIIQAHGGRIWASRSGKRGACFRFTLPVEGANA